MDVGGQVTLTLTQYLPGSRVVLFPLADGGTATALGLYGNYFPTEYEVALLDTSVTTCWRWARSSPFPGGALGVEI